jgi:phospholipase C
VEAGEAQRRLEQIDHIIVLMMENRSFDHMLGYLSLPEALGGKGRTDIDGLTSRDVNFNEFDGEKFEISRMGKAGLTKVQDPGHGGADVGQQMAHGMSGFVRNYLTTRDYQDGCDVMRYQTAENVPIYDCFSEQFAVCDRWFCSIPGSTWPNRLASLTGAARSTDNKLPPVYSRTSFVRTLEAEPDISWRWYSSDPGSLRLVDEEYRVGHEENFAYAEKPTLVQPHTFYIDAMKEDLPNVAWIDPNFVDLGGLQGANDDHPPTDVMAGQSFVMKIYQALKESALWEKSMLVIVYDEHGGFYDHVDPTVGLPERFTERAEIHHFGPRVPAVVVSPFVAPRSAFGSAQDNDPCYLFDHTALIKTILLRFADGKYDGLAEDARDRVARSSHLGYLLTDGPARKGPEIPAGHIEIVTDWWALHIGDRLKNPNAKIAALQELGIVEGPSATQQVESLLGRIADWFRRLFRRKPKAAPAKPAAEEAEAAEGPVVLGAEASELELGVAAAARYIRKRGLPPGQP